jgi:hypothetical protein
MHRACDLPRSGKSPGHNVVACQREKVRRPGPPCPPTPPPFPRFCSTSGEPDARPRPVLSSEPLQTPAATVSREHDTAGTYCSGKAHPPSLSYLLPRLLTSLGFDFAATGRWSSPSSSSPLQMSTAVIVPPTHTHRAPGCSMSTGIPGLRPDELNGANPPSCLHPARPIRLT